MLSDGTLRGIKPQATTYKIADRDGMYVTVSPKGTITFRLDYRLNGRRETLTIGRDGSKDGISLLMARGPYRIPNCSLKAWAVYTNNPLGGAFRGFGVPQVTAAIEQVVDAMADYLYRHNANTHWPYPTSEEMDALIASARQALADLLGGSASEIVFGANMTTLTFHVSRALGRDGTRAWAGR